MCRFLFASSELYTVPFFGNQNLRASYKKKPKIFYRAGQHSFQKKNAIFLKKRIVGRLLMNLNFMLG
jgi:hypothetical protein